MNLDKFKKHQISLSEWTGISTWLGWFQSILGPADKKSPLLIFILSSFTKFKSLTVDKSSVKISIKYTDGHSKHHRLPKKVFHLD